MGYKHILSSTIWLKSTESDMAASRTSGPFGATLFWCHPPSLSPEHLPSATGPFTTSGFMFFVPETCSSLSHPSFPSLLPTLDVLLTTETLIAPAFCSLVLSLPPSAGSQAKWSFIPSLHVFSCSKKVSSTNFRKHWASSKFDMYPNEILTAPVGSSFIRSRLSPQTCPACRLLLSCSFVMPRCFWHAPVLQKHPVRRWMLFRLASFSTCKKRFWMME